MKAILIDDEKPALLQLERMLLTDGRIHVAGKYTNPFEGLDHLTAEKADLVFLDIGMPEMNGLEAAERIYRIDPDIRIVYVTAYAEYAIEAFEQHALDYLLKPVDPSRFAKTLARIAEDVRLRGGHPPEQAAAEPQVLLFKRLSLHDAAGAAEQLKWRTQKSQELFAFLIHQRGQWVTKDAIIEAIWPEYELDKAITHLHTSVYQIRKVLKDWGVEAAVEYTRESYRFSPKGMETDIALFEQAPADEPVAGEREWERANRALSLYRGDYLEDHDYGWAKPLQTELLRRYMQLTLRAAAYELSAGREGQAVKRLTAAQQKDPYSEEICRLLLEAHAARRDGAALAGHYQAFVRLLRAELGTAPERQTVETYERLSKELSR